MLGKMGPPPPQKKKNVVFLLGERRNVWVVVGVV